MELKFNHDLQIAQLDCTPQIGCAIWRSESIGRLRGTQLSPIYTMKNRCDMRCDKLCDRGNPCRRLSQAVASCRNGSSQKLSQVQLLRHGTRHALRHGKPRSQAGRWLIMCVFHLLHWTCDKIV